MPHEIADSDESDLDSPHRPSASPIPENSATAPPDGTFDHDPFAHIAFDQFLSPTQRLSSAVERQDIPSSTERFLQDIAGAEQPSFNSASNVPTQDAAAELSSSSIQRQKSKRSLSDIEAGESKQTSKKRAKTYGSSRVQKSDIYSMFSDTTSTSYAGWHHEGADSDSRPDEPPLTALTAQDSLKPGPAHRPEAIQSRQDQVYGEALDSRGSAGFLSNSIHNTSVTKSSVGGYQGINMDFRGAGIGMDIAANPFGSLSQVSLDENDNATQTAKLASLFQHSQTSEDDDIRLNESNNANIVQLGHLKEMATSPLGRTVSPLQVQVREDTDRVTPEGLAAEMLHPNSTPDIIGTIEPDSDKPAKKKRGRKSKKSKTGESTAATDTFQTLQELDPLDIPPENYKPRPSRSRAGTVDSSKDYFSHDSEAEKTKGQKRQKTMALMESESLFNQNQSSELNLSDPAMIGAPKEMYVPRASKSRSKRVLEDDEEDVYRSEGLEGDAATIEKASVGVSIQSPEPLEPVGGKKKPGRKSKPKRAKISAAALYESTIIDDDDDKDCTIIDQLPSKLETEPMPKTGPVKVEEMVEAETIDGRDSAEIDLSRKNDGKKSLSSAKHISIDLPPVMTTNEIRPETSEITKPDPEPKKRGRKPKKKQVEVQIQAEAETDPETSASKQSVATKQTSPPPDSVNTRPVLSERDQNVAAVNHPEISEEPEDEKDTGSTSSNATKDQGQIQPSLKPSNHSTASSSTSTPTSNSKSKSASSLSWMKPRIGLSRRLQIPSLLRKLDRTRSPPRVAERKEKLSKRQMEEEQKRRLEAEDSGEQYVDKWDMRGKDGMLIEWDE